MVQGMKSTHLNTSTKAVTIFCIKSDDRPTHIYLIYMIYDLYA